ncbi:hypothetical protein ACFPOE_17380 [Caenimonas terrae]|uniref:Uncharacterized protein n=1 Tax=Caenimonas terrae TaxID=696074 RepID=A0ABW0NFB1_9BURK
MTRNSCTTPDRIEMYKVLLSLAALAVSLAASTAQAGTVYFDSGSAKVHESRVAGHKQQRWVPAHRSRGRLVRGHYVRR